MTGIQRRILAGVAFLSVVGIAVSPQLAPTMDLGSLLFLLGFTVLGEFVGLRRPDGAESRLSVAGLVALVTLGFPGHIVILGALGAVALHHGRRWASDATGPDTDGGIGRVALAGTLSGVAALTAALPLPGSLAVGTSGGRWLVPILTVAALLVVTVVADPLLRSFNQRATTPVSIQLHASWQADAVVAASGLLIALAYPVLGWAALFVVALPLLAAKVGLDRHAEIRLAYRQTLRAMSRLPEELGAVAAGHGVRTGELAKLAAQRLGLDPTTQQNLEYAAELHELGAIHAESAAHQGPELLGRAGADVIDEAGAQLAPVAALVAGRWRRRDSLHDASPQEQLLVLGCQLAQRFEDPDKPGSFTLWAQAQSADPEVIEAIVDAAVRLGWPPMSLGQGAVTAGAT